ncbi:MAG: hypothetical protein ACE15D_07460 [Candidatus Eisenbacteria bacterium]
MRDGIDALGRLRLQAVLLLICVLLIGALAGIAVDRILLDRGDGHPHRPPPTGLPTEIIEGLDLTPEQYEKVDSIVWSSRPRTDAIFDELLPRIRSLADSVRAEIRLVLNEEQRATFDRRRPMVLGEERIRPEPPPPGGGPMPARRPAPAAPGSNRSGEAPR